MKRSKKVIFVSHCILNQNARAKSVEKCPGVVKEFLDYCIKNDYGIIQIECPQLQFEDLEREPETKEFYDNKIARNISRKIAKDVATKIKTYQASGYSVCGIFGVEGSPTCGAIKTHIKKDGRSISVRERGIFFEELEDELQKENLNVKIYDWDIQAKKAIE